MSKRNGNTRSKTSSEILPATRRIALVAYPDFEPLDLTGPFSVFAGTDRWLGAQGRQSDTYTVEVVGAEVGLLRASGGLGVMVDRSFHTCRGDIDTLLVVGGPGTRGAVQDHALLTWLQRMAPRVRRLGAVCT